MVLLNLLLLLQASPAHADPILLLLGIEEIKQQKIYIIHQIRLQIGVTMELA
jgi:hypothetical protein